MHDEEALVALYQRALPVIYRYVMARLGRADLAEDVVAEVFLVMVEMISDLRSEEEAGFYAWLIQIAQGKISRSFWTNTSQERVKALPVGSGLSAMQQNLAIEIAEEKQTLHLTLNQVDWPLKVDFTRQLGVVGEPVSTIASVVVSAENSGALQVTLTGSHFSSSAQLVVDGRRVGNISQNTSKKLVASFSPAGNFSGIHTIGILNPDGTAAQTTFRSPGNSSDSATPTPVSTSGTTPTPTHHPDE